MSETTFFITGIPTSNNGPVSTAVPSSSTTDESIMLKYWFATLFTMFLPVSFPENPTPKNLVLPKSS